MSIEPAGRGEAFFDSTGITRRSDGVLTYDDLAPSLVQVLRGRAENQPQVEALVEVGGERLRYGQLWERAGRVAGGLRAAGVRPGDRVSIRNSAGVSWVLAFYGTLLAGAVAVPVNTRFAEREVRYVLEDSGGTTISHPMPRCPTASPSRSRTPNPTTWRRSSTPPAPPAPPRARSPRTGRSCPTARTRDGARTSQPRWAPSSAR